jgi:hypothetical protein
MKLKAFPKLRGHLFALSGSGKHDELVLGISENLR